MDDPGLDAIAALGGLADPVRRRLYEAVAGSPTPIGRGEAADAAGITRTLAAYHLDRLAKDGLLVVSYARRSGRSGPGAGRPAKLYARAEAEFAATAPPRDYGLAALLLAEAAAGDATGTTGRALRAAAEQLPLVYPAPEAAAAARQRIADSLAEQQQRGRITAEVVAERLARLHTGTDMAAIAEADVVIEAVWEDMALKRDVFARLDAHARPGALLATNTSTLDVGQIAAATRRPEAVVGLHFFNPAHIMKLLEVVRAPATSAATLDAARALARLIGKVPVVVGICDGFVGNRLMIARERQAARLLLEGALPEQVDRVLRGVGLPMGTFELQDMAGGIELTYRARQRDGRKDWLIEQMHARGRTGLRAGRGYYRYEPGKRRPLVDPEVTALIEEASRTEGVTRRALPDAEIHDRLILPMINEGAKLLMEGMVERASDIDLVWQLGYGWPDWKGGPMYYADQLGVDQVLARLEALHARHGEVFRPAELLRELAASGARLSSITL